MEQPANTPRAPVITTLAPLLCSKVQPLAVALLPASLTINPSAVFEPLMLQSQKNAMAPPVTPTPQEMLLSKLQSLAVILLPLPSTVAPEEWKAPVRELLVIVACPPCSTFKLAGLFLNEQRCSEA